MKKIYFILSLISVAASATYGQPTLTNATTSPVPGITLEKKFFTPPPGQQGSSGANQSWNWASLVEEMSATGYYINPAGTPHSAAHPTATVCITDNNGAYEYDLGNTNGFFRLGYYNDNSGTELNFSNTTQILKYPLMYNSTWTDTYLASVVIPGGGGSVDGTVTVTADAWGTIITPAGTFTNVLRVHTVVDETYDYGVITIDQSADQYNFISANYHFPVAEVVYGVSNGSPYSSASWANVSVGIHENNSLLYNMSVFPNPVCEKAILTYTLEKYSSVTLQISDITGRIVQSFIAPESSPGRHELPIDASGLSDGIYSVAAIVEGNSSIAKLVVRRQ